MKQLTTATSDVKLALREKKIFDVSGKVKERFRLLVTLEEEGYLQSDVHQLFARRAQDIVSLCNAQMQYFQISHSSKGKQVTVDHLRPFLDTMRRLIQEMPDQIRSGWNAEWFTRELDMALQADNHPSLRRAAVDILLSYIDTLGSEVQSHHISLLLSSVNWNAVRQMSDPQPELFLPKGVRVLKSTGASYDFYPKRTVTDDSQSEAVEFFHDLCHLFTTTQLLSFWWKLFKGALAPILYPQFAETVSGEGVTQGFRGLGWQVHVVVANAFLSLLNKERSAKVLIGSVADMTLLLQILGYSSSILPPDELTALYRTARLYYTILSEPQPGSLMHTHQEGAIPLMTDALANLFQMTNTQGVSTPFLQVKIALFEVACDFFLLVQSKIPRMVSTLRLFLNRVVTPVFRGLGAGSPVYEASNEMVSRSFFSQWVRARPNPEESQHLATTVCALLAGMKPSRSLGAAVCIPSTRCLGDTTFSSNPLILHWRRVILGLLRVVLSMQIGVELKQPFPSLVLPQSGGTKSIKEAKDMKSQSVLSIHKQRVPVLKNGGVEVLVYDQYANVEEVTEMWVCLLSSVLKAASVEVLPDAVQLTIVHTMVDVVSDLLYAQQCHRLVVTAKPVPQTSAPHLLQTEQTSFTLSGKTLSTTLARIALPILFNALEKSSVEFRSCGGPQMAMAGLCDILLGGQAGLRLFPVCKAVLVKALGGGDVALLRVAVFRLFPVVRGATAAANIFACVQGDTEVLGIVPVLALAAFGCLQQNVSAGLTPEKKERECAVRCAAAGLLNVAASVCERRGGDAIIWPQDWTPEGLVATAVNGILPQSYSELRGVVVTALRVALSGSQPYEARCIAMKGLGSVAFTLLRTTEGGNALQTSLINTAAMRLLDANCSVGLEATSALSTLLEGRVRCLEGAGDVAETLAGLFASSLLTALASHNLFNHPALLEALVHALHSACLPHQLSNSTLRLALDALVYAASGHMDSRYSVMTLTSARKEVARAVLAESSSELQGRIIVPSEGVWWEDAQGVGHVRQAAEAALHHLAVHYARHDCTATHPRCSSSLEEGDNEPHLMLGDRALISLRSIQSEVHLTSRSLAGRYTWSLHSVDKGDDSIFETTNALVGDSTQQTGRGRTHALHESHSIQSAVAVQNLGLKLASQKHSPEIPEKTASEEPWLSELAKEMSGVEALLEEHEAERSEGGEGVGKEGGVEVRGGGGGLRHALTTFPLLSIGGHTQGGAVLRQKATQLDTALHRLDSLPDRDTYAVTVLLATTLSPTLEEVLHHNAADMSVEFKEFLAGLGSEVALCGHRGYSGLTTAPLDGSIVYYATASHEMALLATPLLPVEVRADAVAAGSVVVVWSAGGDMLNTNALQIDHATHYIVLSALGCGLVRVELLGRAPFPAGPLHDGIVLPAEEAAVAVRCHAQRCAKQQRLGALMKRHREVSEMASHFAPMNTLSDAAACFQGGSI